jgi:HK97 family phage major capsid protein
MDYGREIVFGAHLRHEFDKDSDLRVSKRTTVLDGHKEAPMLFKNYRPPEIDPDTNIVKKTYVGTGHSSTNADGGETIPTPLANRFIDIVANNTFCRQVFKTVPMTAATLEIPKKTGLETTFLIGQGRDWTTEAGDDQSSTAITKGTWTSITLTASKFGTLSGYTTELGEDSLLNFAQVVMAGAARSLAEYEERSFLQGDAAAATLSAFNAGDVRYAYNGIIISTPGDAPSTGSKWTPPDSSPVNWADGGDDRLTADELNAMIARIENNRHDCDLIVMSPNVQARLRDQTEFEMFQGLKDIGNQAALVRGLVGRYYTADIVRSSHIPLSADTTFTTAGNTMVLGMDTREPLIGDRRRIEIRKRHRFYQDIEETRLTTRVAFQVQHNEGLAGINEVLDAA